MLKFGIPFLGGGGGGTYPGIPFLSGGGGNLSVPDSRLDWHYHNGSI